MFRFRFAAKQSVQRHSAHVSRLNRRVQCRVPSARRFSSQTVANAEAVSLLHQHKFDEAIAKFDAILKEDSEHLSAKINRAVALHAKGERDVARELFPELLAQCRKPMDSIVCLMHLGFDASAENRHAQAVEYFDEALTCAEQVDELQPGILAKLMTGKGVSLANLEQLPAAVELWHAALKEDAQSRDTLVSLAHYYDSHEQVDDAIKHYQLVVQHHPDALVHWHEYAALLARVQRTEQLWQVYEQAMSVVADKQPELLGRMRGTFATLFMHAGQFQRAIDVGSAALDETPVNDKTRAWLAGVLVTRALAMEQVQRESSSDGEPQRDVVLAELDAAFDMHPNVDALVNKSLLLMQMGKEKEAQDCIMAAHALNPQEAKEKFTYIQQQIQSLTETKK